MLGIFPAGWRVPLTYRRDGKRYDVLVRLQGVHRAGELLTKMQGRPPQPPAPRAEAGRQARGEAGRTSRTTSQSGPRLQLPRTCASGADAGAVKAHFEARPGYVNYYFNRQAQERIWKGLTSRGDFAALDGAWTFEGTLEGLGDAHFELNDGKATVKLAAGEAAINVGDEPGGIARSARQRRIAGGPLALAAAA